MIRHIVFDMGGVLVKFGTQAAAEAHAPEDAGLLRHAVFESPWWIYTDRGGEAKVALAEMCRELPERLHAAAEALMEDWVNWFFPIDGTLALAEELTASECGVYLLSNMPWQYRNSDKKPAVLSKFDGCVYSCEEGLLKPDPAFFRRLFNRFSLEPEECFFVDDYAPNIECARYLGMRAHRFEGDVCALRRDLIENGVPL